MTERSIGKAGGSNVPQTKEDIARKIADRHPEVSRKDLLALQLATLKRIFLSGKIPAELSDSLDDEYKMPIISAEKVKKRYSGRSTNKQKKTLERASGGVIKRRGGGIAKRGFGIAK